MPRPEPLPDAGGGSSRSLRWHPRGIWILGGTELWERISFHGMQALLTLYMADTLLQPGHVERIAGFPAYRSTVEAVFGPLSVTALAAQTFGLYVGLVYFTPLLGGILGDRLIGRRAGVIAGGLLMTAGHFCMALDSAFLLALLLLICGAGLLRGNLSPQVTALYAQGDRRQADAFQIFYVGVNVGAFVAPILTGALTAAYGWHFGFGFAGVGMLIGLIIYLAGQHLLPVDRRQNGHLVKEPLTRRDRLRLVALALIFPVGICFYTAQSQVWNVYNLWVRDHVDLAIGGFHLPIPWLQSLDGIAPVLVMPFFLALWRRQAARGTEPDDLGKIARGCLIFGAGVLWLAIPSILAPAARVLLLWPVLFHLVSNIGWLYFTPVVEALYASKAPVSLRGTLLGLNLAGVLVASILSGRLGVLYERLTPGEFWLLHAAIVCAGGVVLLVFARPLRYLLMGSASAPVR